MVCRYDGRHLRMIVLVALVALGFALPVAAQNLVVGKVTDVKGTPVEGAIVTIEQPSSGRKYETKTGKDGTYTQVGLIAGAYSITVTKEGVGTAKGNVNVRGGRVPANFVVGVSAGEGMNKVFNEGVAASAAGNFDEAIGKFNEALKTNPQCADCYYNIGVANAGKKDLDKAEEAYKKSIEVKPSADAYNGLASIYTGQRKLDLAAEAGKKAAELSAASPGGANPDASYNQGVIAFNAGKPADAKTFLQATLAAKPDHAEAHFLLGQVLVGEGNFGDAVKEYETYLKLTPSGPNAKQAQDNVTALKPLVK
jgi:cytochrome c-type biogenesis protein CcmH/NrfG